MISFRRCDLNNNLELQLVALMHHDHYASGVFYDINAYNRFLDKWPTISDYKNFLLSIQNQSPDYISLMEVGGEIVGMCIIDMNNGERPDVGYISVLYITPHGRRKGYGAKLLQRGTEVLKQAGFKNSWLYTRTENKGNMAFYAGQGWHLVGPHHTKTHLTVWEKQLA